MLKHSGMRRLTEELRSGLREMPRGAVITVGIGLALTVFLFAMNQIDWEPSADVDWETVEAIEEAPPAALPGGRSLTLARTTLSAIPQAKRSDLLFRVAGVVTIDSPGTPAKVRCEVAAPPPAKIARTTKKRAVWPRPSEDLRRQDVPELMVVSFSYDGAELLGMPIRDTFRRYSDTRAPVTVDWGEYEDRVQSWTWDLPRGSGAGAATLGFTVVFKTFARPRASLECRSGGATVKTRHVQDAWPVPGSDWEG